MQMTKMIGRAPIQALAALALAGVACSSNGVAQIGGDAGTSAGDASRPLGDGAGAGGPTSLPLPVTSVFNNQGWFGDPAVAASFTPGSMVIQQADSSSGPCANRDPAARGKCLQVIYTPPAGLAPAPGGYVGVFFLTTLSTAHPELVPPAGIGEANWGVEPGAAIPAGATKISFQAAASAAGLSVTFKAGTDKDSFVLAETPETLTTTWQTFSLPLAGQSYGSNVVGGFAWVVKDTARPATFYLDGIVWDR